MTAKTTIKLCQGELAASNMHECLYCLCRMRVFLVHVLAPMCLDLLAWLLCFALIPRSTRSYGTTDQDSDAALEEKKKATHERYRVLRANDQ